MTQRRFSVAFKLWLLIALSYFYFGSAENPNIASRIGLAISIAERHELQLGPFAGPDVDEAFINGTYYSDKAPGLSLLAAGVVAAVLPTIPHAPGHAPGGDRWFDADGHHSFAYSRVVYAATVGTVSLISVLAVVLMQSWCLRQGASLRASVVAALALGLCSPLWGWSTVLLGHATSGALLLMGTLTLITASRDPRTEAGRACWRSALAGALLGYAFVTEFTAGPPVAIIGIGCFVAAMRRPDRWLGIRLVFAPAALGLAAAIIPLLAYNDLAFGSPFTLGYEGVAADYPGIKVGFFGIAPLNPEIIGELLVGRYRGLLLFWPALLLLPAAILASLTMRRFRLLAIISSLVFTYYVCLNSGFYYWDGGWSSGPRHLVAAIPLTGPLMAALWDWHPRVTRPVCRLILLVSCAVTLVYVSITMFPPDRNVTSDPWQDVFLPRLIYGTFNRSVVYSFVKTGVFAAVLPLLAVWGLLGVWLRSDLVRSSDVLVQTNTPGESIVARSNHAGPGSTAARG